MATTSDVLSSLSSTTSTSTTSSSSSSSTGTSSLGKDEFLQLLVTQLTNQNPLDPQDNTEFVSQLAQFSSLESLSNLNTTAESLLSSYQSSQALQASSLVGTTVSVATDETLVDTSAGITGSLVMPSSGSDVTVSVYDEAGSLVTTLELGSQASGTVAFDWDGTDSSGATVDSGTYSFVASASIDGTSTALTTYLPVTVNSVTLGTDASDMTLNLATGDSVLLADVQTISK
ncbi:flagellar hook assembly protein FlgD [Pseudomonas sp. LRF_L74]|uniref:flagellar hook assembly protein FlgD n=1 Tax=Pseudomonas sp. LRF_L74 TaxID=3369422 RepID=UPI003F63F4FA